MGVLEPYERPCGTSKAGCCFFRPFRDPGVADDPAADDPAAAPLSADGLAAELPPADGLAAEPPPANGLAAAPPPADGPAAAASGEGASNGANAAKAVDSPRRVPADDVDVNVEGLSALRMRRVGRMAEGGGGLNFTYVCSQRRLIRRCITREV